MPDTKPIRVLHVEVGGSYGGSLRALEVYLTHSNRSRFEHDLLLYYPTPGAERIVPLVRRLWTLYGRAPAPSPSNGHELATRLLHRVTSSSVANPALSDLRAWARLLFRLSTVRHLRAAISLADYDLVHVNNTFTYQAPTLLAARWAGKPVVAHVRNPVPAGTFSRSMMTLATSVVTVNRSLEKTLRAWNPRAVVQTCYDGAEVPRVDSSTALSLRRSLVPSRGVLIGSVGRLDAQKGYHHLIRAARLVVDKHPEVVFAIAGDGQLRSSLEQLIAQLGLTGSFHLIGFRDDIASYLAALDIFVSSSLWEGLPLAIVEAMLLGKPIVATDVGGNSEVVMPGRTGHLVPPGDVNELAKALLALLGQKDGGIFSPLDARRVAGALSHPRSNAQTFEDIVDRILLSPDPHVRDYYDRVYTTKEWQPRDQQTPQPLSRPAGERFTKMWYRALLRHVAPAIDFRGKRLLEVGCGYGYLAPHVCGLGAQFIGIDISLSALRQFPRTSPGRSYPLAGDGACLPFEPARFDIVVCMEVLEHVPNPEAVVDECFRVTRPGGVLLFSCPNYLNLFLGPKLLADLGVPPFRRYMNRQVIDRTTSALWLHRSLARRGDILLQRSVRLHPPLFEQLDYRLSDKHILRRINDLLFAVEDRWGDRTPLNWLGLHTLCVVRRRDGIAVPERLATAPCSSTEE